MLLNILIVFTFYAANELIKKASGKTSLWFSSRERKWKSFATTKSFAFSRTLNGIELWTLNYNLPTLRSIISFLLHHKTDKQREKHDHAPCGTRALSRQVDANRKRSNDFSILFWVFATCNMFFVFICFAVVFNSSLAPSSPFKTLNFPLTLHIYLQPSVQPTKYHYYPHNQQPYFLPECAIQQVRIDHLQCDLWLILMFLLQVCNAVYTRLNFTQPLCVCPPR